jgi:hypothetical protein
LLDEHYLCGGIAVTQFRERRIAEKNLAGHPAMRRERRLAMLQ